jgi:hypothetical protein
MTKTYQTKDFFRRVPTNLLKVYFEQKEVLTDVEYEKVKPRKLDPLFLPWLELPQKKRDEMEIDFRSIYSLSNGFGINALVEEAAHQSGKEDLIKTFQEHEVEGEYARAFWTFLNRPQYWKRAQVFSYADNMPMSYSTKRQDIGRLTGFKAAKRSDKTLRDFGVELGRYFYHKEGRGKNCLVEHYRREVGGGKAERIKDYFFAYPEDFARTDLEWMNQTIERRNSHPAFEVVFVYSQMDGELDIYMKAGKKHIKTLQELFGAVILEQVLSEEAEAEKEVYCLDEVVKREFRAKYGRGSGIASVRVKQLRFNSTEGKGDSVVIKTKRKTEGAIYDLLDRVEGGAKKTLKVEQAGFEVEFEGEENKRRQKKKMSFTVTLPNGCNLKHDGQDAVLRQMLLDSGIHVKKDIQAEKTEKTEKAEKTSDSRSKRPTEKSLREQRV